MSFITQDTVSSSFGGSGVSSYSYSHTVNTGVNIALVAQILVMRTGGSLSTFTATYNSVSMTKLYEVGAGATSWMMAQFVLGNPATGSNTLAFAWSGTGTPTAIGCAFFGVNVNSPYLTTSPTTANGSSTTLSVAVPSVPGGLVVDCGAIGTTRTFTVGSGQTDIKQQIGSGSNGHLVMSSEIGTGANVTMDWTISGASTVWYTGGFCLFPAPGGGGAVISPSMIFR